MPHMPPVPLLIYENHDDNNNGIKMRPRLVIERTRAARQETKKGQETIV